MQNTREQLIKDADQCVKCAICLPHCPTYTLAQDENESPRGRISLIQALAEGHLSGENPRLQQHLDNCLNCGACQAICPSQVPYNRLIDNAQASLIPAHQTIPSSIKALILKPKFASFVGFALSLLGNTGLLALARRIPGLNKYAARLPQQAFFRRFKTQHPISSQAKEINLFIGCLNRSVDRETILAAIHLLEYFDYKVKIQRDQQCCGALFLHNGDITQYEKLKAQNLAAFENNSASILSLDSGCQATLQDNSRYQFYLEWLLAQASLKIDYPYPLYLHTPCTLRNHLKAGDLVRDCLEKHLAQPQIKALSRSAKCCGAAGLHMLQQPKKAKVLFDQLMAQSSLSADIASYQGRPQPIVILSPNIGCSLHLNQGLLHHSVKIMHPVVFLSQQLKKHR